MLTVEQVKYHDLVILPLLYDPYFAAAIALPTTTSIIPTGNVCFVGGDIKCAISYPKSKRAYQELPQHLSECDISKCFASLKNISKYTFSVILNLWYNPD